MRAFNLYHSPLGDLSLREEVLRKYLPDLPFEDHSPMQLPYDDEQELTLLELESGVSLRDAAHSEAERLYDDVVEQSLLEV